MISRAYTKHYVTTCKLQVLSSQNVFSWFSNPYFPKKKKVSRTSENVTSLGGLEPPTFRLTAERANRLRHRDLGLTGWWAWPNPSTHSQGNNIGMFDIICIVIYSFVGEHRIN